MATARSIPLCWKWRTRRDDDKKDEMIFFSFCFFFLRREVSGSRGPNSIRHGDRNNQPGELFLFQQKFVISFFIPSKDVSFGGSVETWWTWPNRLRLRFGNGGDKKKRQEGDERDHREPRSDEHPGVCVCTSYIQQQLYLLKQTKHNESVKTRKKNWKSKFIKEKEKQVFVCLTSASLSLVIQLHPAQAMPVGTRWRSPLSFGFAQVTRLMFSLSLFLQVVVFFYTASGGCCGQHTRVRIRPEYIPTLTFLSIFTHVSKTERKREKRKKDVTIMNHLWKQKEKKKKKRGREGSSHPLHLVGGFPVADETETKTCVYASWEKFFPFFFFFFSWKEKEGGCNHLAANREHLAL